MIAAFLVMAGQFAVAKRGLSTGLTAYNIVAFRFVGAAAGPEIWAALAMAAVRFSHSSPEALMHFSCISRSGSRPPPMVRRYSWRRHRGRDRDRRRLGGRAPWARPVSWYRHRARRAFSARWRRRLFIPGHRRRRSPPSGRRHRMGTLHPCRAALAARPARRGCRALSSFTRLPPCVSPGPSSAGLRGSPRRPSLAGRLSGCPPHRACLRRVRPRDTSARCGNRGDRDGVDPCPRDSARDRPRRRIPFAHDVDWSRRRLSRNRHRECAGMGWSRTGNGECGDRENYI